MKKRPNRKGPPPISVRATGDEKVRILEGAAAARLPVSRYLIWRALDPSSPPPRSRHHAAPTDTKALTQTLALLGQSRLSSNLNQLARAANNGSLALTPDVITDIERACAFIVEMRSLLIATL